MSAPVFSGPVIRINGTVLDNSKISTARLIRRAEGMAVKGYVHSEFIVTYHGDTDAEPDDRVEISYGTAVFAVHYIDSIKRHNDSKLTILKKSIKKCRRKCCK